MRSVAKAHQNLVALRGRMPLPLAVCVRCCCPWARVCVSEGKGKLNGDGRDSGGSIKETKYIRTLKGYYNYYYHSSREKRATADGVCVCVCGCRNSWTNGFVFSPPFFRWKTWDNYLPLASPGEWFQIVGTAHKSRRPGTRHAPVLLFFTLYKNSWPQVKLEP